MSVKEEGKQENIERIDQRPPHQSFVPRISLASHSTGAPSPVVGPLRPASGNSGRRRSGYGAPAVVVALVAGSPGGDLRSVALICRGCRAHFEPKTKREPARQRIGEAAHVDHAASDRLCPPRWDRRQPRISRSLRIATLNGAIRSAAAAAPSPRLARPWARMRRSRIESLIFWGVLGLGGASSLSSFRPYRRPGRQSEGHNHGPLAHRHRGEGCQST